MTSFLSLGRTNEPTVFALLWIDLHFNVRLCDVGAKYERARGQNYYYVRSQHKCSANRVNIKSNKPREWAIQSFLIGRSLSNLILNVSMFCPFILCSPFYFIPVYLQFCVDTETNDECYHHPSVWLGSALCSYFNDLCELHSLSAINKIH